MLHESCITNYKTNIHDDTYFKILFISPTTKWVSFRRLPIMDTKFPKHTDRVISVPPHYIKKARR